MFASLHVGMTTSSSWPSVDRWLCLTRVLLSLSSTPLRKEHRRRRLCKPHKRRLGALYLQSSNQISLFALTPLNPHRPRLLKPCHRTAPEPRRWSGSLTSSAENSLLKRTHSNSTRPSDLSRGSRPSNLHPGPHSPNPLPTPSQTITPDPEIFNTSTSPPKSRSIAHNWSQWWLDG